MKRLFLVCVLLLPALPGCAVYPSGYGYGPAYSYPYPYSGYGYGYSYPGYLIGPPAIGFGWRPGWGPGWGHHFHGGWGGGFGGHHFRR